MNPWKDLLSKIFPDAEVTTAPEEIFVPADRPQDPVERIHAMRKIRGSSGFARLYGAKDVEQFIRQAAYMRDFTDDYPKEIPFGDGMPTYADMSQAQLRCYFTWRTRALTGDWRDIPYSYVLLYIFELLNTHGEPEEVAARLADCWLEMWEIHPKLSAKLPQWFKDYYISHEFRLPFGGLAASLGLKEFFPERAPRDSLLAISSYRAGESRFFRECPQQLSTLEQAIGAAIKNLAPLFTLHGVNQEETFFMRPARFSFHELYRDAAALPPAIQGSREIRVSHSEIYRLKGGSWSRAMEDAFRPPSHAVGYVVKRLEGELRRCAGFHAPWNDPEGSAFLERWMQAEPGALALTEDARLPVILAETAMAAFMNANAAVAAKDPTMGTPVSNALARTLEQEPLRSILALRGISGFKAQGRRLAKLEDDYAGAEAHNSVYPDYKDMTHGQLRTYLTWRTKYRRGSIERTDTAYALLYARELESGIGTADPLADLCRLLRRYSSLDKNVARRLPAQIEALARAKQADLPGLLAREGVQAWFPALFLFGNCAQLPVFDQLSMYRLTRSRFYRPERAALFGACFDRVLHAAEQAFKQAGFSLRQAMQGPCAPALAGFLLKRMEQRMRERVNYPYAVKADAARMLGPALQGRKKLRAFLASGALSTAIDAAVDAFAQETDLSVLAGSRRKIAAKKPVFMPPEPSSPSPEPPPEVKIDFALLPKIREEARALTEQLIVEDEPAYVIPNAKLRETPPAVYASLHEALSPEQIAIVAFLGEGKGPPPPFDEIAIEAINEVALEVFGDTLIEGHEDGFMIIDEYRDSWRDM